MNYRIISYILGKVMVFVSIFLLLPCIVALVYKESVGFYFLATAAISLALGMLLSAKKPKDRSFYAREGFVVVALSWIFLSILGAVPLYVSGEVPNIIDALFEMVSGFTTTGATIINDLDSISKSILFWRSFSHWIGGMGVIVFIMAILPMAGANNMHLLRAESSGSNVGKLVPKMKETAKILYLIYITLTFLMIIVLAIAGMPLFENICISIGTAGTGGFGLVGDSIASCTPAQQWIITIFMFIFGVNFSFYYLIIFRKFSQAFKLEEVRWYVITYLAVVVLITINIYNLIGNTADSLRHSAFQVASLMSTTGFTTVNYEIWPEFSKGLLLLVMFTGSCAGSTAGGIKISRFVIVVKGIKKEIKKLIHPQHVKITKLDGKALSDESIKSVTIYFMVYIALFVGSFIIISFNGYDFETNFTAVSATINNIGPGLGAAGPTESFAAFSPLSKIVFIFNMLVGRLEIYPMLLLLMPSTWKNK